MTDVYEGLDADAALELAGHIAAQGDEAGFDEATIEDARRRVKLADDEEYRET